MSPQRVSVRDYICIYICSLPNPFLLPVLFVVMSIIMSVSECVHWACVTVRLNSYTFYFLCCRTSCID